MYKDLEPSIFRQRLLVEGHYFAEINSKILKNYIKNLSGKLGMTIIYGPIVKNLAGKINKFHEGFECLAMWAESGVSVYTWNNKKFFSIDVYSCKKFKTSDVINFTKEYFECSDIVWKDINQ